MQDTGYQILMEELKFEGKTWEEALEVMVGLDKEEDQLDMAEWLANHRKATRQEILKEKHRLQRKRAV